MKLPAVWFALALGVIGLVAGYLLIGFISVFGWPIIVGVFSALGLDVGEKRRPRVTRLMVAGVASLAAGVGFFAAVNGLTDSVPSVIHFAMPPLAALLMIGAGAGSSEWMARRDLPHPWSGRKKWIVLATALGVVLVGLFVADSILRRPPTLTVVAGDADLVLSPFTYCQRSLMSRVCADGFPADDLPVLTLSAEDVLEFSSRSGWRHSLELEEPGVACSKRMVEMTPFWDTATSLGSEGTYQVVVSGKGRRGDAVWAFELALIDDRSEPPIFGQVWIDSEGQYAEGMIFNLGLTPSEASVKVTSRNGSVREVAVGLDELDCGAINRFSLDLKNLLGGQNRDPFELVLKIESESFHATSGTFVWPDDFDADHTDQRRIFTTTLSR